MLEGTVLYFHLPTHISHGLIILVAGEKVKSFQTLWFTRLSGFVSAFTEYFQYCCCWPGPIGRIRIFNQRIFHYSFEPNPGLPGYWILFSYPFPCQCLCSWYSTYVFVSAAIATSVSILDSPNVPRISKTF